MRRKITIVGLSSLVLMLFLANVTVAFGDDFWLWCWHRGNTLNVWVYGSHQAEANAALEDWDANTDVNFNRVNFQSDISVIGADYGETPWWGLGSVEQYEFDWWHHWRWCRVTHARARFNAHWGGAGGTGPNSEIRGVLAHEIGHTLGLGHSDSGDCMGKGYYNNSNVTGPQSWTEINAKF